MAKLHEKFSEADLSAREQRLNEAFWRLPSQEELELELAKLKEQANSKKNSSGEKLARIYEQQQMVVNEILRRKILFEDRIDLLATEVLGYSYEDFHREMSEFQNRYSDYDAGTRVTRSMIMAPRGGGKSHILTYVQVIFEVLKNPNIRILITSNTQNQSESFLRTISQHLLQNDRLTQIFGVQKHPTFKWDTKEINVWGRTRKGREATVMCIGLAGGVTGLHFDLIIADDLVDEENGRTKYQRDNCFTWFYKTLYPTLEPDGRLYLIGTRYHPDDLYGRLEKEEFKGNSLVIPAIRKLPDGTDTSFWPKKFPLEKLYSMRRAMGIIIFNTQMQNNTDLMIGRMMKPEMFQIYKRLPPVDGLIVQATDSATSTADKDDFFAHVTMFITKETLPRAFLIDYKKAKIQASTQYEYCEESFRKHKALRVFVESNAGQAYFAEGLKERGLPVQRVYSLKDKVNEMYRVLPLIEDNRFFVLDEHSDFVNDMVAFPDGDSDDLPDACRQALKGVLFSKIRKKRKREPGVI